MADTKGKPKRKLGTMAWVAIWIFGAPIALFVLAWTFQVSLDLFGPGTNLGRRAYAERFPSSYSNVMSANADGRTLVFRPLMNCPQALPASAHIGMELAGFRKVRCEDGDAVPSIYLLDTPWYSDTAKIVIVVFIAAAFASWNRKRQQAAG